MPKLVCRVGRQSKRFRYEDLRLERRGFLSIYSFAVAASADKKRRLELMDRGHAVVILPVDFERQEIYFIEQPRHVRAFTETAAGRKALARARQGRKSASFPAAPAKVNVLELPAGMIDPGETAKQAAARELAEETGWQVRPADLIGVARYYNSVGGCTEMTVGFIAMVGKRARRTKACGDGGESIRLWKYSWEEAFALADKGGLASASSLVMVNYLRAKVMGPCQDHHH